MMLPDLLKKDLMVVFCGTAVGAKSAEVAAYYAGPGNKFWRILWEIGLTPRILASSEDFKLLEFGIGLTDLVKTKAGSDAGLTKMDFGLSDFESKILRYSPRFLAFNGKRAAQELLGRKKVSFGPIQKRIGETRLLTLPSTSSAANRYWDQKYWQELANKFKSAF